MKPWKILESRYLLKRWWMNLREDRVRLPNGTEIEEFHVVEYPDWVCVVCLTPENDVVLVEQFRHGIRRTSLELPAGAADDGETPLDAARRELREETGYEAERWELLGRCAPEPSKHTNFSYVYVALEARPTAETDLDESEELRVLRRSPEEVLRMADDGEMIHGIHQLAVFWAHHRGYLGTADGGVRTADREVAEEASPSPAPRPRRGPGGRD